MKKSASNQLPLATASILGQAPRGFTLVELLISIALIGILSAIGAIGYQNYIVNTENVDAQNALRSIFLMQLDHRADTGSYWPVPGGSACAQSDCTSAINTGLFSGSNTIRDSSPYNYVVKSTPTSANPATGFTACAHDPVSGQIYLIDQNNSLTTPAACP